MSPLNPIDPSLPRRVRGETDPARPGMRFEEYRSYRLKSGAARWSEKWLSESAYATAYEAHKAIRISSADTPVGIARVLRDKARIRAKNAGKLDEFEITVPDVLKVIPADMVCPGTRIKMVRDGRRASPTIDRIINYLTYLRGNIQVVSRAYNSCKQDRQNPDVIAHKRGHSRSQMTDAERRAVAAHVAEATARALGDLAKKGGRA